MSKKTKSQSRESTNIDINIREIDNRKFHELHGSFLVLEFSGKNLNVKHINAIRRVAMDDIPIYAFPPELIKIEGNTSIFNNDYMRLRLSQLPILNFDSEIDYLDNKYLNMGLNFDDPNFVRYEKEKVIEVYINSYNNTPDNMNVTTNDINYVEDGEPVSKYSTKYPILLTQLRPNETFKAHMKAALSNGLKSNIFSASSNCFYDYDDEKNKITLTIESQGQLSENVILIKSCNFIIKKLADFKNYFEERMKETPKYEKNSTMIFEFENEDHTMGEILNDCFQDHPKIVFSGISKPSPLERIIKIKIISSDENPIKYIIESIDYLTNVYNNILKEMKKIKN
jgi:DNA-directed RNA polymerase subunit L